MSVSSVKFAEPLQVSQSRPSRPPTPPEGSGPPGMSELAGAMQELSALQSSDPTRFKQVVGELAAKLEAQAGEATGGEAKGLSDLAGRFRAAAESGQMPDLEPPAPPEGEPPMNPGVAAYAQAQHGDPMARLSQLVQSALEE